MSLMRPRFHFTPERNWINDPNGLVYHNGCWHLFAQHHPDSLDWGPMHWLHATSKDLVHWEHQPLALAPDELGTIFSGCMVLDTENTSGLLPNAAVPMVALFTHHGDHQQQSLAYSADGLHFTKYENNPVIANDTIPDFRDPKVWKNEIRGGWSMVVSRGTCIDFYHSNDLLSWEKTGTFTYEDKAFSGVWECPDFFPLSCDGKTKWVLLCSNGTSGQKTGSSVHYFVGDFDGDTFAMEQKPLRLDYGYDLYAPTTYYNAPNGEVILIGWAANLEYAGEVPAKDYRGTHTMPRVLSLTCRKGNYLLCQQPYSSVDKAFTAPRKIHHTEKLSSGTLRLSVSMNAASRISFNNNCGEKLTIRRMGNSLMISRISLIDFLATNPQHNTFGMSTAPFPEEETELTLYLDGNICEVFTGSGLSVATLLLYPSQPFHEVEVQNTAEAILSEWAED